MTYHEDGSPVTVGDVAEAMRRLATERPLVRDRYAPYSSPNSLLGEALRVFDIRVEGQAKSWGGYWVVKHYAHGAQRDPHTAKWVDRADLAASCNKTWAEAVAWADDHERKFE